MLNVEIKLKRKEIRKKAIDKEISLLQLAKNIGITYPHFNTLLKSPNVSNTSMGTLIKMAHILGFENVLEMMDISFIETAEAVHPEDIKESPNNTDILNDENIKKTLGKWAST